MKFKCDQRLIDKLKRAEIKADKLQDWHIWFAWYPVRIGHNDCRWLEKVQRRFPDIWVGYTGILRGKDNVKYRSIK